MTEFKINWDKIAEQAKNPQQYQLDALDMLKKGYELSLKEVKRAIYVTPAEWEKIVQDNKIKTGWGTGKVYWNQQRQRFEPL